MLLTATLTLLALIIGFIFSMAVDEYNKRRNSEQAEANALGTEYVRAGLLPTGDASDVRELLRKYVQQRILFYSSHDTRQLADVDTATARLQTNLWSAVQTGSKIQRDPVIALAISGMNDVFSSQTYAQAVWRNRIPLEAWLLMGVVAICGNLLLGYTAESDRATAKRFFVLPLLVSIAFFLVADLDNPRHGIISVSPQNLIDLSKSM